MKVYTSFEEFRAADDTPIKPVMTVGSFDGVHLGHQYLINELIQWGRSENVPALVMTFHEHPRTFMSGEEILRITPVSQKLKLLKRLGINTVLVLDFDEGLKATTAFEFCRDVVRDLVGARGLLLGHNNRIGRDREGTPSVLEGYGRDLGMEVRVADKVEIGGKSVSSSAIREHISSGDFLWARKMLGRAYSLLGRVEQGKQLGRTIGFPTINLALNGLVHPPSGVYGVKVRLGDEFLKGAANLGYRPTVENDAPMPLLEVHLLDFRRDCYGEEAEVEFCFRIRDEVRFNGVEALQAQLAQDVEQIRERFAGSVFDG